MQTPHNLLLETPAPNLAPVGRNRASKLAACGRKNADEPNHRREPQQHLSGAHQTKRKKTGKPLAINRY
jgi:hypothetical protein